jgi:dTDP-4-amino-4,6-dideoxygalactose transaminase
LRRLGTWNAQRRAAADLYGQLLSELDGVRPLTALPGNEHVWHLYVVRVADRDQVLDRLREQGIGAGIHYPVPVHLQPAFAVAGRGNGSFPVTERSAGEIISLPIYPGITPEQQESVVAALRQSLA